MSLRINTNIEAQNAYKNLSVTDQAMNKSLEKLSSGFKINRSADDGAGLEASQNLAVPTSSVDNTNIAVDGALSAGTKVGGLLGRAKELAGTASDPSLGADSRGALNNEFQNVLQQVVAFATLVIAGTALAIGANLLAGGARGSGAGNGVSTNGGGTPDSQAQNLTLKGLGLGDYDSSNGKATKDISTIGGASQAVTDITNALNIVSTFLSSLNALNNGLQAGKTNAGTAATVNTPNVSLLNDNNTPQSLETKQQLGIQALGIANESSQTVLALFRD